MDKVMLVEETVFDSELRCQHVKPKKDTCYTVANTRFVPQQAMTSDKPMSFTTLT